MRVHLRLDRAALAALTPMGEQSGPRIQVLIPLGGNQPTSIQVFPGDWLVEVRLPSGETINQVARVEAGEVTAPRLRACQSLRGVVELANRSVIRGRGDRGLTGSRSDRTTPTFSPGRPA
jgi:hypothetical protein